MLTKNLLQYLRFPVPWCRQTYWAVVNACGILLIWTWMIESYFILLQSILVPLSRSIRKNSLQYLSLVLKSYLKKRKRMTMTCRYFLYKPIFCRSQFLSNRSQSVEWNEVLNCALYLGWHRRHIEESRDAPYTRHFQRSRRASLAV